MTEMTVGELKTNFSEVLERVQQGEQFAVLYGRARKPVAKLVPHTDSDRNMKPRKLGILEGRVEFIFGDDFKMTEEELLGL